MYNVVFEYTAETGGYKGVRTWTSFASKESFDAFYTDENIRKKEHVVEKGISEERCLELVKQTPIACYVGVAIEEITRTAKQLFPES